MPAAFIADIESITAGGRRCFQWGGDWSGSSQDTMHWQIGVTKEELAEGVVDPGEDDMPLTDADIEKIAAAVEKKLREKGVKIERSDYNNQTIKTAGWNGPMSGAPIPDSMRDKVMEIHKKVGA
jgi:hypothetical protein